MNILWLSRHEPTKKQMAELKKIFGDKIEVCQITTTIRSGEEVLALMKKNLCQEVVAVLPVGLLEQVTALGVKPIRAVMDRRFKNDKSQFIFSHFERIEHVEMTTNKIGSESEKGGSQ